MNAMQNVALWNAHECHDHDCRQSGVGRHILDAGCYYEAGSFTLFSLPCELPRLFTVRFTAPADFTPGDVFTLKERRFTARTRTMEEPEGKLFSAGAVVQCDIDMERGLAFVTTGGEAQIGSVHLGSALPEMDGMASAGLSTNVSREDHVHPVDTSRLAISGGVMTGAIGWADSAAKIESGSLTGDWTVPTPTNASPATAIATKEYVDANAVLLPDYSNYIIIANTSNSAQFPTNILSTTATWGEYIEVQESGYINCGEMYYTHSGGTSASSTGFIRVIGRKGGGGKIIFQSRSVSGTALCFYTTVPFLVSKGDKISFGVRGSVQATATWAPRELYLIPFEKSK